MNETVKPDVDKEKKNAIGTFEIAVKFTQNATWQGHIHWIENNQKQHFRSALEMIKLMDEALAESVENKHILNW